MSVPNVVFVLGGPGAGKGTQCKQIAQKYGFVHLCAGDILKAELSKPESVYRAEIEKSINKGEIVPVTITLKLLDEEMNKKMAQVPPQNNFLLDGFPRNMDNFTGWNEEMKDKTNLLFIIFFQCSDQTCMQRCVKRGEEGSGRSDDNEQSMKGRLAKNKEIMEVIDRYESESPGLVRTINSDRPADEVFADVQKLFEE